MEVSKRWYIGRGRTGTQRLKNIIKLAELYYDGNVSKLINTTLDEKYNLDPVTGEPKKPLPPPPPKTPPPFFRT